MSTTSYEGGKENEINVLRTKCIIYFKPLDGRDGNKELWMNSNVGLREKVILNA